MRIRSAGKFRVRTLFVTPLMSLAVLALVAAGGSAADLDAAAQGYKRLRTEPYAPADITDEKFDRLWEIWPDDLKSAAEKATSAERRRMAYSRYGFIADPEHPDGPPMGMVGDGQGGWVMNCLACHQGKVAGRVIPGLGNSHFAFQTFAQDIGRATAKENKGSGAGFGGFIPLGRSNGTTNAQIFSVVLSAMRDKDLNLLSKPQIPQYQNHDLDAPPYWNVKRKKNLYIDGFVPKTHRVIMQFALVPTNDADSFKNREDGFRDILAWIESLQAPRYPWAVDVSLAAAGRAVFERSCSECHGTYGPGGSYPERRVPLETVGTDGVRLTGMPPEHRRFYRDSWFGDFGKLDVVDEPDGYVAPPLDGVWASAPYFHNGAVPTLWHVLHSDQRPAVWMRTEDGYDRARVGLEVTVYAKVPEKVKAADEKRRYFDTGLAGKSAGGHHFPDELSESDKTAVLEYLKTL